MNDSCMRKTRIETEEMIFLRGLRLILAPRVQAFGSWRIFLLPFLLYRLTLAAVDMLDFADAL